MAERSFVGRAIDYARSNRLALAAVVTIGPAAVLGAARCGEGSGSDGVDVRLVPAATSTTIRVESGLTPIGSVRGEATATVAPAFVPGTGDTGKGPGPEATFTPKPTEELQTPTSRPTTVTPAPTSRPTDVLPTATPMPPTPRPTERPTAVPTPTEKPPSADFFNREKASQIIVVINEYRASRGLPPYKMNQLLTKAAEDFAMQQAPLRRSGHEGIDGSSPVTRVQKAGYKFGGVAEISTGSVSPDPNQLGPASAYLGGWQSSPYHNDGMLNSDLTEIGVGCYASSKPIDGQWYEVCYVDMAKPGNF